VATKRMKVEICGLDTATLPLLSAAEMRACFLRLQQQGDRAARETLVHGNLRLVLSILQRFQSRADSGDDLFQVGCMGLLKAIDNFDLSHNVRFSTYAVPMIIGEIRRYLRDNNPLRVSRSVRDLAYKVLHVRESWHNEHGCEPTLQHIADVLHVAREDVAYALEAIQDPVSLFEPVYREGGDPMVVLDQIGDEDRGQSSWIDAIALRQAMHRLGAREQKIVTLRFYEGKTQTEVAIELGISQAQVSRLEKSAMHHMRKHVEHKE
jgi:RNA polymerase sporulation-specific sigma factor